jgi:8-oxo-dGTP pyrophosphatase MutT (NUDIX family)
MGIVPVVDRPEPQVLLTLRTELPSHPGQIAFPGGKIDAGDAMPASAALREVQEEIGLAYVLIEPIGYLDLYLTFSGYRCATAGEYGSFRRNELGICQAGGWNPS